MARRNLAPGTSRFSRWHLAPEGSVQPQLHCKAPRLSRTADVGTDGELNDSRGLKIQMAGTITHNLKLTHFSGSVYNLARISFCLVQVLAPVHPPAVMIPHSSTLETAPDVPEASPARGSGPKLCWQNPDPCSSKTPAIHPNPWHTHCRELGPVRYASARQVNQFEQGSDC